MKINKQKVKEVAEKLSYVLNSSELSSRTYESLVEILEKSASEVDLQYTGVSLVESFFPTLIEELENESEGSGSDLLSAIDSILNFQAGEVLLKRHQPVSKFAPTVIRLRIPTGYTHDDKKTEYSNQIEYTSFYLEALLWAIRSLCEQENILVGFDSDQLPLPHFKENIQFLAQLGSAFAENIRELEA